tara:strand:- start:672 stop:1013 length:342 start_codon:yes stop_codon:yes gene_type:complete
MIAGIADFLTRLNFDMSTGNLSDVGAFMYYGLFVLVSYYMAMDLGTRPKNLKIYGSALALGGMAGIGINRYRRGAYKSYQKIMEEEGMSKDTAYIANRMGSGVATTAGLIAKK